MRPLGIRHRRKPGRSPDNPRQHGRLTKVQLRRPLPKIQLTRRFNAPNPAPEINAVHVHLQDLVLGEIPLQPKTHKHLQNLSMQSLTTQREGVSGQLLSQSARPLRSSANHQILHHRTRNPNRINAPMFVKPRVLPRQ